VPIGLTLRLHLERPYFDLHVTVSVLSMALLLVRLLR
jgi:hypothetical protein